MPAFQFPALQPRKSNTRVVPSPAAATVTATATYRLPLTRSALTAAGRYDHSVLLPAFAAKVCARRQWHLPTVRRTAEFGCTHSALARTRVSHLQPAITEPIPLSLCDV